MCLMSGQCKIQEAREYEGENMWHNGESKPEEGQRGIILRSFVEETVN